MHSLDIYRLFMMNQSSDEIAGQYQNSVHRLIAKSKEGRDPEINSLRITPLHQPEHPVDPSSFKQVLSGSIWFSPWIFYFTTRNTPTTINDVSFDNTKEDVLV